MSELAARVPHDAERFLRTAAIAFAFGFSAHGLDHLLRGLSSTPARVIVVGTIQGLFAVVAIWMVLTGHAAAPKAAVLVGFGSALLFSYGHLFPFSLDSFVSSTARNVTWYSWVSAAAEIGTGIVFGVAALRVLKQRRELDLVPQGYSERLAP